MKALIINQNAPNKGDRAVLLFMLRELIANGVRDIVVSTNGPWRWREYRNFDGASVRFVPRGWDTAVGPDAASRAWRRAKIKLWSPFFYGRVRATLLESGKMTPGLDALYRLCNPQLRRAFLDCDYVLTTGGHRLTTILQRDVVCMQTLDMSLAVLYGKPLALWSQTIGPFEFHDPRNERQVRRIIESADRIYVRDETSIGETLAMGGAHDRIFKTTDSVFGLHEGIGDAVTVPPSDRADRVGIAIYAPTARTAEQTRAYVEALTALIRHVRGQGLEVLLIPMEMRSDHEAATLRAIVDAVADPDGCRLLDGHPETPEHLEIVAGCRYFVGHKTHSVIFALIAGTPLVAIAYHPKARDFMDQYGLGEFCVPDAELTGARLIELFEALVSRADEVNRIELEVSARHSARVRADFTDLVRHMMDRTGTAS